MQLSFVCLTQSFDMSLGYVMISFVMLLVMLKRMTVSIITIHYSYGHHGGVVVDVDDADDDTTCNGHHYRL